MAFLNSILDKILVWGTVALGLGFVIFVHELGHFLLAKWNGVKVQLFALGFGPVLVSYRKGIGVRLGSTRPEVRRRLEEAGLSGEEPEDIGLGETEYSIRAIPLGGFVKMLGEGEGADSEEVKSADPRAYPNKSVGARMSIISAGVIMNALFGLLAYIGVYGRGGLEVIPARIGAVVAGHPAYAAGIRAGDEVVAVNGRSDLDFLTLKRITAMSSPGEVLHLTLRRPGSDQPVAVDVEPRRQTGTDMKTMGILMPSGLEFAEPDNLPNPALNAPLKLPFGKGDTLIAAGAEGEPVQPVSDPTQLNALLARDRDKPLVIEARHSGKPGARPETLKATVPPLPFVDFGLKLTLGPVVAIAPGSPAASAGFRVGDRIVAVDNEADLDPMHLPDLVYERANRTTTVKVVRSEGGKPEETVTLTVTPTAAPIWTEMVVENEPLEIPGLGLAVTVVPTVAAVKPGSPAEKAGIEPGQTITSVTLVQPFPGSDKTRPLTIALEGGGPTTKVGTWPGVFSFLQLFPRHEVALTLSGRNEPVKLTPEPDASWMNPMRGLEFTVPMQPLPPMSAGSAVRRGLEETYDAVTSIYAMLRNLIVGDISPDTLVGPIGIAGFAAQTARAGWVMFLHFLGMLSLNLAVINFLPIPPLDGGQMFFLIAEKLRGKPLSEKAVNVGSIIGLLLVLGLMFYVMAGDVRRLLGN